MNADLKKRAIDVEQALCAADPGEPVDDDVQLIYFALCDAALSAEIRALEWALDAFMGGDYDHEEFAACEEIVKKRIRELKERAI